MTSTDSTSFNTAPSPGIIPVQPSNPPPPSTELSLEQRVKQIEEKLSTDLEKCFQGLENRVSRAESLASETNGDLSRLKERINKEFTTRQKKTMNLILELQQQLEIAYSFVQITNSNYQILAKDYFKLESDFLNLEREITRQGETREPIHSRLRPLEERQRGEYTRHLRDLEGPIPLHRVFLTLEEEAKALCAQNQQFSKFIQEHSETLKALQTKANAEKPAPEVYRETKEG